MEQQFPLYGVPCIICERPGLAFVPATGVKHAQGWCVFGEYPGTWSRRHTAKSIDNASMVSGNPFQRSLETRRNRAVA